MIELSECFHYGTIAGIVGLSSFGAGIGQGLTGRTALKAMDIQPQARGDIGRTAMMGMALIDTASILCLTVAFMMVFGARTVEQALYTNIADLGILLHFHYPVLLLALPHLCLRENHAWR